ncbi:MAG: PAS domain S-box protein [Leptolinea sp.]|nr:PAS domain S-box protein [Leptolinea sp.]
MRRIVFTIIILLLGFSLTGLNGINEKPVIRVGIYSNPPKLIINSDGTVKGFWPDLLGQIAHEEDWQLVWVRGTWQQCLDRLENNEIDILPDMGWSADRAAKYSFNTEPVLTSWSRVYTQEGEDVETVLDLREKKVGGLTGSINYDGADGIKTLASKFEVDIQYVDFPDYVSLFKAIKSNRIDAGVANKDFGDYNEKQYGIARTPILLHPSQIFFAFPKNSALSPILIKAIDNRLKPMKTDSGSDYYRLMDLYLGERPATMVPGWVSTAIPVGVGLIIFLIGTVILFRVQLRSQTERLLASESRYRALMENNPDLILRISGEGVILDYHTSNKDVLSISPDAFTGKNVIDVFSREQSDFTLENLQTTLQTGNVLVREFQLNKNSSLHDMEVRYTASGSSEVIAIIRDITERKQAERMLHESEARYETLARVSPVGIFRTDVNGATNYVNPTWSQISGIPPAEAMGDGWIKAVHPDDRLAIKENWDKTAAIGKRSIADYRFIRPDGSIAYVIGQAVPEFNDDNQIVGYIGTITDITERKQAEIEIRRSQEAERAAVEINKIIQAANQALTRSLDLDEVMKTLLDYLSQLVPFDRVRVLLLQENANLEVCLSYGYPPETVGIIERGELGTAAENPLTSPIFNDKQIVCVDDTSAYSGWEKVAGKGHGRSWMGLPLVAGGQVLGMFTLDKDEPAFYNQRYQKLAESLSAQAAVAIQNATLHKSLVRHAEELEMRVAERTTELAKRVDEVETLNRSARELNKILQEALEKAESADRLKSAFLATMSHELRTPLNSIIGFTGILLQKMVGPLSDEQEKQLGMVQSSARHLLDLINDVLDISKIEANQIKLVEETFDAVDGIRKSLEKIRPLAEKKGLELIGDYKPAVAVITSDHRRFEQILLNLLNNAVKFTDKGYVQVRCRMRKGRLTVQVKDTGIGIKPEDLESLFQPFRQLDSGLTRQYEGTGLGLSICKRLVDILGGEIRVESEPGKGSIFTVELLAEKG